MSFLIAGILALHAATAENPALKDVAAQFEERSFTVSGDKPPRTVKYRLLRPEDPKPGEKYPVVLFLHGAGERGDDNLDQLKYLPEWMTQKDWRKRYPCYLIAPQCPEDSYWSMPRRGGGDGSQPGVAESDVAYSILESVLTELPIDRQRIYLTGLSMGGYGSWALAAKHPEVFAAVVPICGGGSSKWGEKLKDVPIWAVHGGADNVVPVAQSRNMIEAVTAAGGKPRYTELVDVGHDSWTPAYNNPEGVLGWMFEQRKVK